MIGLRTKNECIEANFGETPFLFEIEEYAKVTFKKVFMYCIKTFITKPFKQK